MRRVVITRVGAVSPFGFGAEKLWKSLLDNKNGISKITDVKVRGDIVNIAGMLPKADYELYRKKDPELFSRIPEDESIKSFFIAINEALSQSGLDPRRMESTDRIGAFIADRMMGSIEYVDQYAVLIKECLDENSQLDEVKFLSMLKKSRVGKDTHFDDWESVNHYLCRSYNISGPLLSPATACASGNTSIGEAFYKIKNGYLDAAITGGAYNYDLSVMIGFTRIGALTSNPDPDTACCPFDIKRNGFVMSSGCGVLILEDMETAKKRGANILCEVTGYGYFSDAFRTTDPDPEAKGSVRTIKSCLEMAKLNPDQIGYINAHGTSTKMNDLSETIAIKKVFGQHAYDIPISSTKSMIGHSIMAAAALEGVVCVKSIIEGTIHPTRNYSDRDPELDLNYTPNEPREKKINHVLSNSFGFGGQNTSVIFSRV